MTSQEQPIIESDPHVVGSLGSEENDDADSIADSASLRDSTASITSSILNYRTINGRKYQASKTTEYWAPTDDQHVEGFDVAHHFTMMLLNDKLFSAPIVDHPQAILDVGTGTGIWAIDMADEYPSAEVIGTDISAVQPDWVPPNCHFQIDDAQLDWTFRPNYFDLIHTRYLYGAIDDWHKFYRQALTHLKPGGYFEHIDFDLETRSENPKFRDDPEHIFKKWAQLFFEAGDKVGRTFRWPVGGKHVEEMRKTGFVDVVHKQWKVPIGGWPRDPRLKKIGLYNGHYIDQSLEGYAVYPIGQVLGWSFDEVTVLVSKMREAIRNPKSLPYLVVHGVYGRKPEDMVSPAPSPEKTPSPPAGN